MKALKVLGIIVGILAIAVGVLYFGWLKAPSTDSVCDHVKELMKKELPAEAYTAAEGQMTYEKCAEQFKKGSLQGHGSYVKDMKCVMAADSLKAVQACD